MPFKKEDARSVLYSILGALSFLMLLPGLVWWAGLFCAFGAVVFGSRNMRQPGRFGQITGICAVVLAILGTGTFIVTTLLK